ncbi:probable methyltransferase ICS2 [Aristolochia californica]|uniref:probable methyltransferase ICS2 n=1 Tax=Aristolochia californica TaxID=171875 RepID=UPI0035DF3CC3
MDLKEVLCMNGGEGDASYAKDAFFVRKVNSITKPLIEKAIRDLCHDKNFSNEVFSIADLASSSGPSTLSVISGIVKVVAEISREANWRLPEFRLSLNDLPMNDFNSVFRNLAPFHEMLKRVTGEEGLSCFVAGVPGSFYGRLFPRENLHFVRASYCIQWLSRVPSGLRTEEGLPLNKGKIYISKTSPPGVWEAYLKQFQRNFSLFLKHRSEEIIPDGRMVVVFHGRPTTDPTSKEATYPWELMAEVLSKMVQEGIVGKEKLDSFNMPYYTPSSEEVVDEIHKEGSFAIECIEIFSLDTRSEGEDDNVGIGEKIANKVRSFSEPVIANHFGEELMDNLYLKLAHILEDSASEINMVTSIFIALRRRKRDGS